MVVQLFGFDAGDRILPIAPWPSFVGMRTLLRAHLAGAALVSAWIDKTREALGDTLRRYGVTRMYATPWHLRRLLQSPAPSRPWPPLRSVNTTGAAITIEEIMAARSQLAPNLFVEYGTNEISYVAQLRPDAAPLPGCVGSLLPGVEMRADDESGNPLPPGQVGDLGFRCAWMCSEYAGNPEATRLHFRGGWFYPGDAGYLDAGNRLFISGRTLEAINCGGLKIWPDEIESVIKRHPMVTDVAVVGLPHPLAGQIAAAFVVLRPTIVLRVSPRELHEFCAISLEKPRVPPHFFIVARIPRNQAGKVMRDNLISAYPGAAEMVRDS
jgi:acyl-coenzyme A synthetase/AMP-(fatty) acid ligase